MSTPRPHDDNGEPRVAEHDHGTAGNDHREDVDDVGEAIKNGTDNDLGSDDEDGATEAGLGNDENAAGSANDIRRVGQKAFPCTYKDCPFSATRNPGLQDHIRRKHTGEKPFVCTHSGCTYKSASAGGLRHHANTHLSEADGDLLDCDHPGCAYTTYNVGNLWKHKKGEHPPSGSPNFFCPFPLCNHTSNYKANMDRHIAATHVDPLDRIKPFTCDFDGCSYATDRRGHLTTHVRIHTGDKPYLCDWPGCKYRAAQPSPVQTHKLAMHSGLKPYVCAEKGCVFVTADRSSLRVHFVSVHTTYRPLTCDLCPYATADRANFYRHMDTHTGVKPFVCAWAGCEFRSARKAGVDVHSMTHTGERPFSCPIPWCDYASTNPSSLKYHFKAYHTADGLAGRGAAERGVANVLTAAGFKFKREHQVYTDCLNPASTYSKIDFVLGPLGPTRTMVFLEVDEHAHSGYAVSCEVRRMADVTGSAILEGNTLPIAWIRFNPDDFRVDGALHRPAKRDRYPVLIAHLHALALASSARPVTIEYLFYDMTLGRPAVLRHADYKAEVRDWVQ